MMKAIISGLMCLPFVNLFAQDAVLRNYPKYYQDGDYWVQALVPYDFEDLNYKNGSHSSYYSFMLYALYVEGDTIIENKEYKCVNAKTWIYDCEETNNHQPRGLYESIGIDNVLFMREDADGRQWRKLGYWKNEALLFDFSRPFEVGQTIKYCKHLHLSDVLEDMIYEGYQARPYSDSLRFNARKSRKVNEGTLFEYTYYNWEVNSISTFDLPNGEQVPFANGRIAFGWGDVYQGDLLHQYAPGWDSEDGRFLYRVHQGQIILKNQDTINRINNIIGTDILSLFDKPSGITETTRGKAFSNTIFDLSGRKVNSQLRKKGVNIVNGKKLLY